MQYGKHTYICVPEICFSPVNKKLNFKEGGLGFNPHTVSIRSCAIALTGRLAGEIHRAGAWGPENVEVKALVLVSAR